jgi:RHS repeat-associated protein
MIRILLICLFSLISSPGLLFAREVVFYHTDNVGSPVAMTDSKGTVVWRANDLPFGEEYQTTENPQHNSRRFIGKEKDKETGLVYIGARYLDPVTGRFLQPDPVGPVDPMTGKVNAEMLNNPQRLNRYAYGLNNPYRYIDPDGCAIVENKTDDPVVISGNVGKGHGSGTQSFGVIPSKAIGGGADNSVVGYQNRSEAIYASDQKNYGPHRPQGNISDIDFFDNPANKTHTSDRADIKVIGDDKGPTFDLNKNANGTITPDAHNLTIPGAFVRRTIENIKGRVE